MRTLPERILMTSARTLRALPILALSIGLLACDPDPVAPDLDASSDANVDAAGDAASDVDLRALPECAPPGARFFTDFTEADVNGWTVRATSRDGSWAIALPPNTLDALPSCLTSGSNLGAPTRVSSDAMSVRYGVGSFRTRMDNMDWALTHDASEVGVTAVSYTHLTLPTIYSV